MEHRWSSRVSAALPFEVYQKGCCLGRSWSRDVSQGGLFLETGSAAIALNSPLELRFQARGREHRLRGLVIHRVKGEGVGVQLAVWRTDDNVAYDAFLEFSGFFPRPADRMVG